MLTRKVSGAIRPAVFSATPATPRLGTCLFLCASIIHDPLMSRSIIRSYAARNGERVNLESGGSYIQNGKWEVNLENGNTKWKDGYGTVADIYGSREGPFPTSVLRELPFFHPAILPFFYPSIFHAAQRLNAHAPTWCVCN